MFKSFEIPVVRTEVQCDNSSDFRRKSEVKKS